MSPKQSEALYLVRIDEALPHLDELLAKLPMDRKQKALRYVHDIDRGRSAVGSLLIAMATEGRPILLTESGKPYVEDGPYFSLSHAGAFVGLYVSRESCGLDIEELERCDLSVVKAAFTPTEAVTIRDKESMAKAWTLKEALAKCEGHGVLTPRSVGAEEVSETSATYLDKRYYRKTLLFEGHAISMVNPSIKQFPIPTVISVAELK